MVNLFLHPGIAATTLILVAKVGGELLFYITLKKKVFSLKKKERERGEPI